MISTAHALSSWILAPGIGSLCLLPNDVLYELAAPAGSSHGFPVCRIGDVDGDGRADFAAVVRGATTAEVRIHRSSDGAVLSSVAGSSPWFGRSLADAGDVDGDGSGDVLVGEIDAAHVYSGRTGSLVLSWQAGGGSENFGQALARVDDVDGDGVPDLAIGVPQRIVIGGIGGDHLTIFSSGPGFVEVRSGAGGGLLRVLHGSGNAIAFGGSIAAAADVDGDGVGEIAVASHLDPFPAGPTALTLVSGATGSLLWEIPGLGGVVARLGDVDADGRDDLLVGDLIEGPNDPHGFATRVVAVSATDGRILWTRRTRGEPWDGADHYGSAVATIGDLDGDGVDDGVVGAHQPTIGGWGIGPGYAQVLSGRDGSILSSALVGRSLAGGFGRSVCSADDVDSDGLPDLVVAEPETGRLRVYSGDRRNSVPQSYCVAAPNGSGSSARMRWSGTVGIGASDLVLAADGVVPGSACILLVSARSSASRVSGGSMFPPNGFDCLGVPPHVRAGRLRHADPAGVVQVAFEARHPPPGLGSIAAGSTWNFQFVYRDPASFQQRTNRSDALSVTFRP